MERSNCARYKSDRSRVVVAAADSLSEPRRVRGQLGVLVKMGLRVVSLAAVDPARMIVLPGSVHHRVKSLLVRVVADHPKAATWILHGIFPRHAAPYEERNIR